MQTRPATLWPVQTLTQPDPALTRGCVLVPTMGALHAGHASLLRLARKIADERSVPAVATVFVNPTQFNESTDFDRYPRTLDADLAMCEAAGIDAVLAPHPDVVYPPDDPVPVPALPPVATRPGLEDHFRPGHFPGVCQVVSRLFDLTDPSAAVFGEKDWQQLQVVRAMTIAQGRKVDIVPGDTVREPDGLAMSSRNTLLDKAARAKAPGIAAALFRAASRKTPAEAQDALRRVLQDRGIEPEYAVIRDAETLLDAGTGPCRLLVAARVGGVRLIDNTPWMPA